MEAAIPGKRVTRIAKALFDVGWWLVIVGAVLALVLTFLWPVLTEGGPYWGTKVSVSISDDAAQRLLSLTSPDTLVAREPAFTDVEALLRFEMFGFRAILLEWVVALPFFAAVVFGLHLARAFLRDVLAEEVFSAVNGKRLSQLGWLLIGAGVGLPLLDFLHAALLVRGARFEGVPFSIGIGSMGTVLPGIMVLVVAGAWRYGAELQKDRDLVV